MAELQIPELAEIIETQTTILHSLQRLSSPKHPQYWYNLREACELKGVNFNTVKTRWYYKPKGGKPDTVMHGVYVWSRESIDEWIQVDDTNRAQYLAKYGFELSPDLIEKWAEAYRQIIPQIKEKIVPFKSNEPILPQPGIKTEPVKHVGGGGK